MSHRRLFILCEGDDDQRFFERVCETKLRRHYDAVQYYQYAQKKPKKVQALIRSIRQIDRTPNLSADYLFVHDFDRAASISRRKEDVRSAYSRQLRAERIVLVVQIIEGWYAAGVSSEVASVLGVNKIASTDDLLKPQFDTWIPERFEGSRIDFMQEVLKYFDRDTACAKNASFDYFCTTFL